MRVPSIACLALGVILVLVDASVGAGFKLENGDRVVLIGNTLIEREQRYGYWETALTISFPDKNVIFRNLGWSGDTVWGEARAGFETAKEGYQRLVEATLALKPTVIIIGYGTNESFAGEAGLARFREQFKRLLDDLKPSKARMVLLAPPVFEKETWRAANFAARGRDLKLYTEAIAQLADQHQAIFAEEFWQGFALVPPLTDDGMHLTTYGYSATASYLLTELGSGRLVRLASGAMVRLVNRSPKSVRLEVRKPEKLVQAFLPSPPIPHESPPGLEAYHCDSFVIVRDLKPGRYTLKIDGLPVQAEDAQKWLNALHAGVGIVKGPSLDQAEKLRRVIVEKNRLFFNRWRPQNETYLYGFRKYEQGQNAREIPEFDPLIEKLEKEIARLRKPVPHTYQLVPAEEVKK